MIYFIFGKFWWSVVFEEWKPIVKMAESSKALRSGI